MMQEAGIVMLFSTGKKARGLINEKRGWSSNALLSPQVSEAVFISEAEIVTLSLHR